MKRTRLIAWDGLDDTDNIGLLSKRLSETHFDVQVALVKFFIADEFGENVPDPLFAELFRSIGKLQRASINLKIALLSYRTTVKLQAV